MTELLAQGTDLKGLVPSTLVNPDGSATMHLSGNTPVDLLFTSSERQLIGSAFTQPLPLPPRGKMIVALDIGGWGGSLLAELAKAGIRHVRVNDGSVARALELAKAGLTPATISVGGGANSIAAINPQIYAQKILGAAEANPNCERIEVLNEPELEGDGKEFRAFLGLLKVSREAINTLPILQRPLLIASWAPTYNFGKGWAALGGLQYVDEVVVHAYGGSSGQHKGLEGARDLIKQAHEESAKPVAVTEVGWPTALARSEGGSAATRQPPTGDSQQWTEGQQAKAIPAFVQWAASTGYVSIAVYFNGVDYGTNNFYGIERLDQTHKPSFAALASVAT